MRALKFSDNNHIIELLDEILKKKKLTREQFAKKLKMKEFDLIEALRTVQDYDSSNDFIINKVSIELNVLPSYFFELNSGDFLAEKVKYLLKQKGISFVELAKRISYSNAGLHRAFNTGTLTISTLSEIARELNVSIDYFFEEKIIDRLAEEVMKYDKSGDLKIFLFGFSRDLSKGMKFEDAVRKNQDPDGYKNSLGM